jgi:hypothetical protein
MPQVYHLEDEEVDSHKQLRVFGEDEATSGSESGLDITGSARKSLDLSQYIDGQLMILLHCWKLLLTQL